MSPTGERILVAESDPDISDLIARQALKPLGYDVKVVVQASQAIDEALKNPPDLIIADLELPDLGGKDVLAAISSHGVTAPMVVIAQKGDERRAIDAFRLGAADALLWPARDAEVVRVVERAMQPTRFRRVRRQLYQLLEASQEELKRRGRDLNALLQLNRAATSGADLRQLAGRLLDGALQIADADTAWLLVRDDATETYLLRAHRNLPVNWARKLNQALDDGLSSLVIHSGQALTIHGRALEKFKAAALGRSAAVLPIKAGNEILGILLVLRKADVEFERSVQALLEGIANLASMALLNSRLFRALETAGRASRAKDKSRRALLDALASSNGLLDKLLSGEAGDMTREHKESLAAIASSLRKLERGTESVPPPGAPGSS